MAGVCVLDTMNLSAGTLMLVHVDLAGLVPEPWVIQIIYFPTTADLFGVLELSNSRSWVPWNPDGSRYDICPGVTDVCRTLQKRSCILHTAEELR